MTPIDPITADNDSTLAGERDYSTLGRRFDRGGIAFIAIGFMAAGGALALGIHDVVTPDSKPIIRTIVLDVPPACADAIDAAQQERAHTETEQQHADLADERAADLADVALTLDPEAIEDAATALDAEKRLVQQAQLDRGAAASAFDAAAGDCLPEVDR